MGNLLDFRGVWLVDLLESEYGISVGQLDGIAAVVGRADLHDVAGIEILLHPKIGVGERVDVDRFLFANTLRNHYPISQNHHSATYAVRSRMAR